MVFKCILLQGFFVIGFAEIDPHMLGAEKEICGFL